MASQAILATSTAAGIASAVAIPFASFVPITRIQVGMVLRLSRVFGLGIDMGRAKEILVTFGAGLLGSTLIYELVSFVQVAGWAVGSAIAVSTTLVLSYSTATWFAHGERQSAEALKRLGESLIRTLAARLKRHPDRTRLKRTTPGPFGRANTRTLRTAPSEIGTTMRQPPSAYTP